LQRALSTIVLLGLLLASAAAFAITEHLKLIKSPVFAPHVTKKFSPVCHCATDNAEISFKLRHPDSVTVTIVGGGHVVDTLPTRSVPKNVLVTFRWNGRADGRVASNGSVYQPQVKLANDRRTILMPNRITVDTTSPKVLSASDGAGILIRGRHHGLSVRYAFSEKAHAALYVDGRRVVFGRRSRQRDKVKWNGGSGGKKLAPGRYVLEVAAVDAAGNVTPPAGRKRLVVEIRAIALSETSIHVTPGQPFTVKVRTAARHYRWKLSGAHGVGKEKLLHLRAPLRRGRYRLVVKANGDSASATVVVGRA
jgi:hypothetical protein